MGVTARHILISGCSTGIGRASALALASRGWHVLAGIRRREDADALRALVGACPGEGTLTPVRLDVCDERSIAQCAAFTDAEVSRTGGALWGVVNNAGIVLACPSEFVPLARLRQQLEVNFVGAVALTQALLPMLRASRGRVVNISSISGRLSTPLVWPYAASKAAMVSWSEGLRMELAHTGVRVCVIEPGAFNTEIWSKSADSTRQLWATLPPGARAVYGRLMDGLERRTGQMHIGADVRHVVDAVVRALEDEHPRPRVLVGTDAKLVALLKRWLPDPWMDRVLLRKLVGRGA